MRAWRFAFFMFVATLPSAVLAADWQRVTESSDGTTILVDASSISNANGVTSFWVKFDYSTKSETDEDRARKAKIAELARAGIYPNGNTVSMVPTEDKTPDHDLQRWQIKCVDRTFDVSQSITYNTLGHVVYSIGGTGTFTAPLPDSVGETIIARVCK